MLGVKAECVGKAEPVEESNAAGTSPNWSVPEVVAARAEVPEWAVRNIMRLLDEGCTLPFIARYRKEQTGGMDVQKLRDVCHLVNDLKSVQHKIESVIAAVEKLGKMTAGLRVALRNAQMMTEVEDLYAPYKPGNKGSLAERSRALGLEPLALQFVNGDNGIFPMKYVKAEEKGLANVEKVLEGVKHIIADMIHKDTQTMDRVRQMCMEGNIMIESSKVKTNTAKSEGKKSEGKTGGKKGGKTDTKAGGKPEQSYKFENYFDKKIPQRYIKPHQVLALNRGEDLKILTVKVTIPDSLFYGLRKFCCQRWIKANMNQNIKQMMESSIDDTLNRLIHPQMCRLVRSQLTKTAEKSSIEVFATNLKSLLLTPPLKGHTILAIDPGFKNGCKSAVISPTGQILATEIIYMHDFKSNKGQERNKLIQLVTQHKCEIFAIGNGVACRETESFISDLISKNCPHTKYCIIDECGASIYSVSDAAQKEMPSLDPSLRGAVSIGRRLLDPLAEFVKIDPKHVGVGQYQHDMPQNQLKSSLDSVVEECVSFVGVDINTSSECLLSRVAGLSSAKAKKIVEFRETTGPFICREQLMCVKGLGEKSYEQAAGFVRVHTLNASPDIATDSQETDSTETKAASTGRKRKATTSKKSTSKKKKKDDFKPSMLDMTWIHPESYALTHRLLEDIQANVWHLGQPDFIQAVQTYITKNNLSTIAQSLDCGEPTVKLITDALVRPLSYDFRDGFQKPLFRSAVHSINELSRGEILTGKVTNVTHFGAFVDVGVGQNGLIHTSKMTRVALNGKTTLDLGDKVEVKVINVEVAKNRLGLELIKIL